MGQYDDVPSSVAVRVRGLVEDVVATLREVVAWQVGGHHVLNGHVVLQHRQEFTRRILVVFIALQPQL